MKTLVSGNRYRMGSIIFSVALLSQCPRHQLRQQHIPLDSQGMGFFAGYLDLSEDGAQWRAEYCPDVRSGNGSRYEANASTWTRCRPDVSVMLWMACSRKPSSRLRRYGYSAGMGGIARMTMNSVEPQPTASFGSNWTKAVLPFSKQGVIRARRVSSFRKRAPDLNPRKTVSSGEYPVVGNAAISR